MPESHEVIVIGAGAAGLSALRELDRAGVDVLCLEARDRIGGRILTVRDPLSPIPVELGAEFIHGRPQEIWSIIRAANLATYDVTDHALHIENGTVQSHDGAWLLVDQVNEDMRKAAANGPDQSFAEFISRAKHPEEAKRLATNFVEGFNAARAEIVGIASLAKDMEAADEIDGDSSFRLLSGYDAIPLYLLWGVRDPHSQLRLNTVVEAIDWRPGSAAIRARSALTGSESTFLARHVILTVPLGVLQNSSIQFTPEPVDSFAAARRLAFGQVFRATLRFREAVWEHNPDLADAGFLLSDRPVFPTWWTTLAVRAPIVTGWSSGPRADPLLGQPRETILSHALESLASVIGASAGELSVLLESFHFHDWYADPYACGAYSYVPVNALSARECLARPVEGTLYFSGEAAERNGHSATVHGAIASGLRAACQVLDNLKS
jgi:monoamine oxidase